MDCMLVSPNIFTQNFPFHQKSRPTNLPSALVIQTSEPTPPYPLLLQNSKMPYLWLGYGCFMELPLPIICAVSLIVGCEDVERTKAGDSVNIDVEWCTVGCYSVAEGGDGLCPTNWLHTMYSEIPVPWDWRKGDFDSWDVGPLILVQVRQASASWNLPAQGEKLQKCTRIELIV